MMIIYSTTVSLFNTITEHIHTLNKSCNMIKNSVAVQVLALATTHGDFHFLFIVESPSSKMLLQWST